MGRYFCKECRYRFESDTKKERCPYCGKNSLSEEQTAEEIVGEVEKLLE